MSNDEAKATARMIVDAIISDLNDLKEMHQSWEDVDDDLLEQIRSTWITLAMKALRGK